MFETPTYIVLDLPAPVSAQVHAMRERYDRRIASLPVEITIAGSSGIGVLSRDQQPERVFDIVESVGRKFLPFRAAFVAVSRFPEVPVFWLKPGNRVPFDVLQSALIAAGLRFEPHRFAYNPHCTISASVALNPAQERQLLNEAFPTDEFLLSRLSLYQPAEGRAELIRTFWFDE